MRRGAEPVSTAGPRSAEMNDAAETTIAANKQTNTTRASKRIVKRRRTPAQEGQGLARGETESEGSCSLKGTERARGQREMGATREDE